jgi:hypothetical protein
MPHRRTSPDQAAWDQDRREQWVAGKRDGAADGANDRPNKAFGPLFQKLSQDCRPFRKLLRDRILEVWPIAPGTDLLGEVVAERRLHSVLTAAQEAGIGAAPMEQLP